MNNLQVFEEMIPRHKALLAEHWGCTHKAAPEYPRSWLAHVQNWLFENIALIALYRTTAPNP